MKFKFFTFLLLGFLFTSHISFAASISAWSISSANLVSGNLFLNATGTTSVTYNVSFNKATGETGVNIQVALATKKFDGTMVLLSTVGAVTDADYPSGALFGNKSITVSISNSAVVNSTVYLVTAPNPTSQFSFFSGPYTVTNSSTPPSGAVSWNGATNITTYVLNSTLSASTIIHTSLSPVLTSGQSIFSPNHSTQLALQTDGNLVIYQVSTGKALWASNTNNNQAKYLFFQGDGNLVLTTTTDLASAIWASNIYANGGNEANAKYAIFALQGDGNLIMMEDSQFSYGPRPGYYLVLGDTGTGGFTVSSHYAKIK